MTKDQWDGLSPGQKEGFSPTDDARLAVERLMNRDCGSQSEHSSSQYVQL